MFLWTTVNRLPLAVLPRFAGAKEAQVQLDQTVLIGKSDVCLIQLSPSVSGVDPVHCRLRCKDGAVTLEDLGSEHGTFLQNGERLTAFAPVSLAVGDCFSIGEPDYRFEITLYKESLEAADKRKR